MAIDKAKILRVIDSCMTKTSSKRKKSIGLPALRRDIETVDDKNTDLMIAILLNAICEPEPTGNAPDTANKYWVNRQSTWIFRGGTRKTSTFIALQNVIREYCSDNYIVAPGPKIPFMIPKAKRITSDVVLKMKDASRRLDGEICIAGHGQMVAVKNPKFKVPAGTYIKFYVKHMGGLTGADPKAILAPEIWGRHGRPVVFDMYGPGMMCDDYVWGECDPRGHSCFKFENAVGGCWSENTNSTRRLSQTIAENMGVVHCIFCRAHPTDDKIMMAYGGGKIGWGGEKCQLKDSCLQKIGLNGGKPGRGDYLGWQKCGYDKCWCNKPKAQY